MSGESGQEWCQKVIQEKHVKAALTADMGEKAELLSWSIENFTQKGDNFATVVTSLKVSYMSEGKTENTSYIAKVLPNQGFDQFKDFLHVMFKKEGGFYEYIVPLLNAALTDVGLDALRTAKWYYSSLEEEQELIILEDLRLKGFKMFDRKKGMDTSHTLLVLEELARLHSASIILQEKQSLEELAEKYSFLSLDWSNYPGSSDKFIRESFEPTFESAIEMLQSIGGYEAAEKWLLENNKYSVDILNRSLAKESPFCVICHGDCWNNNVLFRYDDGGIPVEVMLIDLQLSRVASAATDLNYLFFSSLTGDVRRTNENHFLTSYYKTFVSVMTAAGQRLPFTSQDLLQEYRRRHEYGLLFGMMLVMMMIQPDENKVPDFHDAKNREVSEFYAEWKKTNLAAVKSPQFKSRFLSLFDDMMEHGVIQKC